MPAVADEKDGHTDEEEERASLGRGDRKGK